MVQYWHMRYNIAQHASKGGKARYSALDQSKRIEIARKGAQASNKRYEQARASEDNSPSQQDEGLSLITKYGILVSFLRSKDVDINDLFEEYLGQQNSE